MKQVSVAGIGTVGKKVRPGTIFLFRTFKQFTDVYHFFLEKKFVPGPCSPTVKRPA